MPYLQSAHVLPAFTSTFSGTEKPSGTASIAATTTRRVSSVSDSGTSKSTESWTGRSIRISSGKLSFRRTNASLSRSAAPWTTLDYGPRRD